MVDLANVTLAFEWVRAYHDDLAKLRREIESAFVRRGYRCLTSGGIDCYQAKMLAKPEAWAPPYAYQFFVPPEREDVVLVVSPWRGTVGWPSRT